MSKIKRLLRVTAVAALLPVAAHAGTAYASETRTSGAQQVHTFGDPDSGGEVWGHGHRTRVTSGSSTIADKGDVIVTGPGGTRPTIAMEANGGGPVGGPGGTGKPIRPTIMHLAMLSEDGPVIRGPGGGTPPIRPTIFGSAGPA